LTPEESVSSRDSASGLPELVADGWAWSTTGDPCAVTDATVPWAADREELAAEPPALLAPKSHLAPDPT
jgi:hypothetical protein